MSSPAVRSAALLAALAGGLAGAGGVLAPPAEAPRGHALPFEAPVGHYLDLGVQVDLGAASGEAYQVPPRPWEQERPGVAESRPRGAERYLDLGASQRAPD